MKSKDNLDGIDTLVFDIGDVLISSNFTQSLQDYIPKEYIPEVIEAWCMPCSFTEECSLGEFLDLVSGRLKPNLHRYIPDILHCSCNSVHIQPYTYTLLSSLKKAGYELYYLSNWSKWSKDYFCNNGIFDFLDFMDDGIFSCEVECMKPDKKIYEIFLKEMQLDPTKCIFFDDKIANIKASIFMGMMGKVFVAGETNLWIEQNFLNVDKSLFSESVTENMKSITKKVIGTKVDPKITPTRAFDIAKRETQYIVSSSEFRSNFTMFRRVESQDRTNWDNYNDYRIHICTFTGSTADDKKENFQAILLQILDKCNDILNPQGFTAAIESSTDYSTGTIYVRKGATIRERTINEYGTTAGTVVGTGESSDDVYIIQYMAHNAFSGENESKFGICKTGMKDLHIVGGKFNRLHYISDLDDFKSIAKDIHLYKFTGTQKNSFYDIIEDSESDLDFYSLLTGDSITDRDLIKYDPDFIEEVNFIDQLNAISECIIAEAKSLTSSVPAIPVLMDYVEGRPFNYYRDLDGIYIQHEITRKRSASYNSIEEIPWPIHESVKNGGLPYIMYTELFK